MAAAAAAKAQPQWIKKTNRYHHGKHKEVHEHISIGDYALMMSTSAAIFHAFMASQTFINNLFKYILQKIMLLSYLSMKIYFDIPCYTRGYERKGHEPL